MHRAIVSLIALLPLTSLADNPKPLSAQQEIEALVAHNLPNAQIGIALADANTGRLIYEHNAFQTFTPASNTKLLTGAAALATLGPEFRYTTSIDAKPSAIHKKQLKGNLYITFTGDPSLRVKHLKALIKSIAPNLKHIKGNVIIDNTRFSGPQYAPGWSQEDLSWYFNAPISTIILNQNTIDVNLIPNNRLGGNAKLAIVNPAFKPYFNVRGQIKTVTYPESMKHCSLDPVLDENNTLNLSGCWPISNKARTLHFAIKNPDLFAQQLIQNELKQYKIRVSGRVQFGKTPQQVTHLAQHQSRPLKSLLRIMLKDSNNIYAESLTKTLGYHARKTGSFQEGTRAINAILQNIANIDSTKWVIKDGSGGSHYNLVSPKQLVRLLFAVNHMPMSNIFKHALPESGEDGTLQHRMKSFDLKGKLFAKTGSMSGISTLSGYIKTRKGQPLVFAIMINHLVGDLGEARMLQAKIASVFYAGTPWS